MDYEDEQQEQSEKTLRQKAGSVNNRASSVVDAANKIDNIAGALGNSVNALGDAVEKYKARKNESPEEKQSRKEKRQERKEARQERKEARQERKEARKQRKQENRGKPIKERLSNLADNAKDKISNIGANVAEKVVRQVPKINEKTFKKTLRTMDIAVPGAGKLATKLYDSRLGKTVKERVRGASNPISAVKEGISEIKKKIKNINKKKVILMSVVPTVTFIFIVVIVVLVIVSKFTDSQTYFKGDPYILDSGSADISKLDKKYEKFYQYVEKYSSDYSANRAMIIAVLTAYDDNDNYSNLDIENSAIDEESGTDTIPDDSNISKLSKSRMKKYIKKVAKKLQSVQNVIDEGDYENKETGSEFFWWLMDDFVSDYYADYLNKDANLIDKKKEIVRFIYLYYNDIKVDENAGLISSVSCPNGVTVEGSGTYDFEEYIAGVVNAEIGYDTGNNIEAMKAQAVAARTFTLYMTENCTKPIANSQNAQVFKTASNRSKEAAKATEGQVLTYNGNIFLSQYDHYNLSSCSDGWCTATYTKQPNNEKHEVKIPETYANKYGRLGGHGNGMSQVAALYLQEQNYNYEKILKYFYSEGVQISKIGSSISGGLKLGSSGIYAESIFPLQDLKAVEVTQGYRYGTGEFHGAIDIICSARKREPCIKIPIYAAHDGVITKITNQYCTDPKYTNRDTTLKSSTNCLGKGIWISITDSSQYNGYKFGYWHFETFSNFKPGDKIKAGQFLGYMGSTGKSTTWHLHFEIHNPSDTPLNQNNNIVEFGNRNTALKIGPLYPTNEGPKF